jgi:hypothetical protein
MNVGEMVAIAVKSGEGKVYGYLESSKWKVVMTDSADMIILEWIALSLFNTFQSKHLSLLDYYGFCSLLSRISLQSTS